MRTIGDKIGVYSNILKQINAKVRKDLYKISIPLKKTMVVGVDVVNEGSRSIVAMTSSYS